MIILYMYNMFCSVLYGCLRVTSICHLAWKRAGLNTTNLNVYECVFTLVLFHPWKATACDCATSDFSLVLIGAEGEHFVDSKSAFNPTVVYATDHS